MTPASIIITAVLDALERDPALAARVRRVLGVTPAADDDWIPLARAPIARKTGRRLARTGEVTARQVGGRWYLHRGSLAAYMRSADEPAANDDDADLRRELGLAGGAR